jgi:hypothetical protein
MTKNGPTKETALHPPTFGAEFSRNADDERTLYVLGLSLMGTIVANAILLVYFASLRDDSVQGARALVLRPWQ